MTALRPGWDGAIEDAQRLMFGQQMMQGSDPKEATMNQEREVKRNEFA